MSPWQNFLVDLQESITGSYYIHIALGTISKKSGNMIIDEIMFGERVRHGKRNMKHNYNEKMTVEISKSKYRKLKKYLRVQRRNRVGFNHISFFWNFFPITSLFPLKGYGVYCVQLLGEALHHAEIINLDGGTIRTDSYIKYINRICCCCCCPPNFDKPKRVVKIPYSYQMTPKMLWDIVKDQNKGRWTITSTQRNINTYATRYKTVKKTEKTNETIITFD
jgi:hypothetical protein